MVKLEELEVGKQYLVWSKATCFNDPKYTVQKLEKILKTKIKLEKIDLSIGDLNLLYEKTFENFNFLKRKLKEHRKSQLKKQIESLIFNSSDKLIILELVKEIYEEDKN